MFLVKLAFLTCEDILKASYEGFFLCPNFKWFILCDFLLAGVYIYGLFLDGAGWDKRNCKLIEPTPKVLYTSIPVAHVFATNLDKNTKANNMYECPVYKKPRRTDLTYIFPLYLKTSKPPDHWTLRGVGLLCDTK